MGFCFFNNAAIAARHAQTAHGAERVAIVDWDVHHGNGTQDIFWDDPTCSTARRTRCRSIPAPARGSSAASTAPSSTCRCAPGDGGERSARPSSRDPAALDASGPTYHHLGRLRRPSARSAGQPDSPKPISPGRPQLMEIADRRCGGRVVSLLEGGYDLEGLARSAAAHVKTLMGLDRAFEALGFVVLSPGRGERDAGELIPCRFLEAGGGAPEQLELREAALDEGGAERNGGCCAGTCERGMDGRDHGHGAFGGDGLSAAVPVGGGIGQADLGRPALDQASACGCSRSPARGRRSKKGPKGGLKIRPSAARAPA